MLPVQRHPPHLALPPKRPPFPQGMVQGSDPQQQHIPTPNRVKVLAQKAVVVLQRGVNALGIQGQCWVMLDKTFIPSLPRGIQLADFPAAEPGIPFQQGFFFPGHSIIVQEIRQLPLRL